MLQASFNFICAWTLLLLVLPQHSYAVNYNNCQKHKYGFAATTVSLDAQVRGWGAYSDTSPVYAIVPIDMNIQYICATERAWAALSDTGKVVTWGDSGYGGDSSSVVSFISTGIVQIVSTDGAFAALASDGTYIIYTFTTTNYKLLACCFHLVVMPDCI